MFRDESIGVAAVDIVGEKLVLHSEIYGKKDREKLRLVAAVSDMIDDAFRSKGVEKLYTYSDGTDESYRYNIFLGYKPNGLELTIDGVPTGNYEFEKVLI